MKKFILSAIAVTMVASPLIATAAEAAPQQRHVVVTKQVDRGPNRTVVVKKTTRGPQYRSDWRKGQRFDYRQARNYRQIDYRQHRNLKAPPRGYRYVQSGNDAVLVGISTGIIAAVLAGALR
ncbi:hypothetical protein BH09PSE4_BH09PSE4_16730 [soil metagenome]